MWNHEKIWVWNNSLKCMQYLSHCSLSVDWFNLVVSSLWDWSSEFDESNNKLGSMIVWVVPLSLRCIHLT